MTDLRVAPARSTESWWEAPVMPPRPSARRSTGSVERPTFRDDKRGHVLGTATTAALLIGFGVESRPHQAIGRYARALVDHLTS
ncbi:hypothetical protein JCM4814A_80700 [Streptomyces phaeofaciens JCM 4814]|uniref:Uncharacterized protein n=1 Tax=Streptomyces phaeofaciens TaxID=68254 RepID=A0A918M0U8_9ACTN|nr:hypothetical protein GCM10010226_86320 [Streptomyces phaeofaciens]